MNATATSTTDRPLQARAGGARGQSKIYQAIATPINFIAFIVSLYLIDNRNRAQHERGPEGKANGSSRRTWLHKLLYRQRASPYDWVDSYQVQAKGDDAASPASRQANGNPWFYQTKQKKLLRVEAADAFALRSSVLFALGVLTVSAAWLLCWAAMWLVARVLDQIVSARV
ncbi:hypothetical protein F4678DRAFT_428331 [Xylaria arbuscula]|nr:hypothetical protein F4678DRAFT_428331 [Xylaria arbuscula]